MTRKEILKQITEEQQKTIGTLRESINTYNTTADIDESEAHDIDDLSKQDQARDIKVQLENRLTDAEAAMEFLKSLSNEENRTEIESGSIIETGKAYFFAGVALQNFSIGQKDIYFISEDSPAFRENAGKKAGDELVMGSQSQKIEKVF